MKKAKATKSKSAAGPPFYELSLFITGVSPNSLRAVSNIKIFCEQHLKGHYQLKIIDVHQEPSLAAKKQLIALPLLVRTAPLPERRLIGDLSDMEKVRNALIANT